MCPLVAAYKAESGEPSTYWTYVECTDDWPIDSLLRASLLLTASKKHNKNKEKYNENILHTI